MSQERETTRETERTEKPDGTTTERDTERTTTEPKRGQQDESDTTKVTTEVETTPERN